MAARFTADDAADTQALLKTGFDSLYCCYVLLRVADGSRARAWLRKEIGGVALVEWLLTSAATPLYGSEVEPLRQELRRAVYLLAESDGSPGA